MINLELKDLRKDYVYVIRVYGKELMKVNSKDKLFAVKKALNLLGIESKNIHAYKISCRKVVF